MKFGRTLGFVVAAALIPVIAQADTPNDPYAQPPAAQPAPTSTTTVVAPAPAPAPAQQTPVVVVNPEPRPAHTTVITHDPETYTEYDAWNAPVFATGALVFAGSYGASAIVAAQSDRNAADRLYVPVVGPWLALNDWSDCPIEQPRCDRNTTDKVLLVADGVFQAAGVITMVTGVLAPSSHTVAVGPRTAEKLKPSAKIAPTSNGFALVGRF